MLRIIFCAVIGYLLAVPYLKLVGGALLLWIGIKLVVEEEEDGQRQGARHIWGAIWTIVVADAVMSLDNAIAIAAAANGDFTLIMIGLVHLDPDHHRRRHPDLARCSTASLGSAWSAPALIGWIAGEVIAGDGRLERLDAAGKLVEFVRPGSIAAWLDATLPHAETVLRRARGAASCSSSGSIWRHGASAADAEKP